MKLRTRLPLLTLTLLLLAALACNVSGTPTPPFATSAAQTVEAILTSSAIAPTAASTGTAVAGGPTATESTGQTKPSDTPGPTNTPGAQGCVDNAQFVTDVTIPDNTVFAPGTAFTKTWRLRNTGTCNWVSSYSLAFVSGEAMGGPAAIAIASNVAPGAQYDASVNMVAPNTPGAYKGIWQMRNTVGALFGSQPFVQIVVASPTATNTNTSPPQVASATPTQTNTPTQPAQPTWPLVQQGDSGANVFAVQYLLRQRGYTLAADGAFGPQTTTAVKDFQTANSLTADGIVGPLTWPKLIVQVQQGSNGEAVRAVQRLLVDEFGYTLNVDGIFGPATDTAVKDFQTSKGLTADGIVGPNTWSALVNN